jgi:CTP synthase
MLGIENAHSTEMDPHAKNDVINMMEEQKAITMKGGTMRLGAYPCEIREGTLAHRIYGTTLISERHRHRYEFNNEYLEQYENNGMIASGKNKETGLVEIIELPNHPFFVGCQYHPELKSTVENPHPLFVHFVKAAKHFNENRMATKNPLLQSELI